MRRRHRLQNVLPDRPVLQQQWRLSGREQQVRWRRLQRTASYGQSYWEPDRSADWKSDQEWDEGAYCFAYEGMFGGLYHISFAVPSVIFAHILCTLFI